MRLLLVDDESQLTAPLQQFLCQQGYEVDVADSGELAWQKLLEIQYDLVVLDWMIPGMSGIELCRQCALRYPHTPILFLTARDTLDDRVEGLESGANDYLVKPFELRELLARIRAQLRRGAFTQPGSEVFTFHDLTLDCGSQMVRRGTRSVILSDKEFQLLYYFLQHPDRLLTHAELTRTLWGEEHLPSSNALVAQVKLLRRKIDAKSELPLIHTIYGKGYRLSLTTPQSP